MRRFLLGLAAGAIGTAGMTASQELLPRLRGDEGGSEEEPAPAQAARKVLGAAGFEPPRSWTSFLAHGAHWSYGVGWGGVYALLRSQTQTPGAALGLGFGVGVWIASYAQLVPLGVYEPPWRYAPAELAEDASYHVVYGLGVAAAYAALTS